MRDVAQPRPGAIRGRALLITGVVAGLIALTRWLPVDTTVASLRAWAASQGAVGMIGFGSAYTLAALLFVPGALLTVVAGGIFGLGWGIVIVAVATTFADAISFVVARYLARDAVERAMARYPRFEALDRAITKGGWRVVALLRLSPTIPYSASNYLYGLTGIPFLPYLVTSGVFTLPGTVAFVYLGYLGAETVGGNSRTAIEWTLMAVGFAATALATGYLAVLARRELARSDTS